MTSSVNGQESAVVARNPVELQEALRLASGKKVLLHLTDNRSRMVSMRREPGGIILLRLQRSFLEAPPEVIEDLAMLAMGRREAGGSVQKFVNAMSGQSVAPRARKRKSVTAGQVHDLDMYCRLLNETYLNGRSKAAVTWGRKPPRRKTRTIRLGCYNPETNCIVMSRRLDSDDVPRYFVEYVLFHEMLHEVLGIGERPDGKRDIHGKLFRLMESTFPGHEQALKFEKSYWGGR